MGYDGSLKFDTGIDESGFNSGVQKLGSIAKSGMAIIGTAVAGGVAAFGVLTKASLDSVASLEQNVGGVETLFKDSADVVIANAKRAYETAGMSANDYMSTVTSFSASLLQSLGGDTEKAAKVADMAITDMSDNANKMGTSMELIQNAYQGFAKQNYTMLDNLKLGYGGTKTEMQRLLKEAQKISGIKYDINNLNDVYEAIHVIQTELGISGISAEEAAAAVASGAMTEEEAFAAMGTTAKEAATTIEGSMSAAKAAWDNFMNGTASADEFADAFGTAAQVVIKNLGQIIPRLVETVPGIVKAIYEQFKEEFQKNGSKMLEFGERILLDLLTGITENLPEVIDTVVQVVNSLIESINENLPQLLDSGGQILLSLINGIILILPTLIETGILLIQYLVTAISENLPTLVTSGLETASQFINGILQKLPDVITSAGTLLDGFLNYVLNNLPTILNAGIELVLSLVNGIIESLPEIASSAISLVGKLLKTILSNAPQLIEGGLTLIGKLVSGIIRAVPDLIAKIPGIISDIKEEFTSIDWGQVGKDILSGIAKGLTNGVGAIIDAAKEAAGKALEAAKDFLGIHSPSTVFRDVIGKNMALGVGVGFKKNVPIGDIENSLDKTIQRANHKISSITTGGSAPTVERIKRDPTFASGQSGFDFKEYERVQRKLNKERDGRPIYLGTERIDKPLPKGAVPQLC